MALLKYSWKLYILNILLNQPGLAFMFTKYDDDPHALMSAKISDYIIKWDAVEPFIQIANERNPDRIIFQTLPSWPFLTAGFATESRAPIVDGNYKVNEWVLYETPYQSIREVELLNNYEMEIRGEVYGLVTRASYILRIFVDPQLPAQLQFDIKLAPLQGLVNRLFLNYWCDPSESFHGFGLQYTHWNLKGKRVPILVAEQGIGRGQEPITSALNYLGDGAGGDWSTTYAPKPIYITSHNRSVVFENSETMFFDLRDDDAVVVEVWGLALKGRILHGYSMLDLVKEVTEVTGRMNPLPEWTQTGAVVGLEGGTEEVTHLVQRLQNHDVPVAAVWLQDWVGLRHAFDGDRLVWNWSLDKAMYKDWDGMVTTWRKQGVRVMSYINPFFANPDTEFTKSEVRSGSGNQPAPDVRNLFLEGLANNYFIMSPSGGAYVLRSGSIEFHMVDLTNPSARVWMKDIIKEEMLRKTKVSGWMADFGEYLPFDALLHNRESGAVEHNLFPQRWAQVNKEAVDEYEASQREVGQESDEVVYFMRSAWLQSPGNTPLFWQGDQLVSWDKHDGIRSVITSTLSGGLGGHALTHSDIGGYTMQEVGPVHQTRSRELLQRWTEMSAFGSCLFRTHIGSSTSPINAQIYDDDESMAHFAYFTNVYSLLAPYRLHLMHEAATTGAPVMRPMAMHYAYDTVSWTLTEQYLFGPDFLVAPVMDPQRDSKKKDDVVVKVYIPAHSDWVHLWSGRRASGGVDGRHVAVPAPLGQPPVFFRAGSPWGLKLQQYLNNLHGGISADAHGEPVDLPDYVPRRWDWMQWLGISEYASAWTAPPIQDGVGVTHGVPVISAIS